VDEHHVCVVVGVIVVAALAAGLVGVSTLVSRVWGHAIGGIVSAFPLIVGPVLFLAARREDAAFAAQTAVATLLGLVALSGFALVYGRSSGRWGWLPSVALGWAAAAAIGFAAARIETGLLAALAVAVLSIALARAALPRGAPNELRPALPGWELPARMALTALLIVGITLAAERFGPVVAGILAALPTLASVLAVFTHARDGHDALLALLRGMLAGLAAFVIFCASIAVLIEPAGVPLAFVLATSAAVLAQLATARLHASAEVDAARSG
jgi:uncharacterized membrane protein (GlpM family)